MAYAIKHKETGKFFSSFEHGPEFNVIWSDRPYLWDNKEHAIAQASLLRRFDHSVQLKPVAK